MADQPQLIAGRYEVQGLLDEGGMGEIYRAFDRNLACQVVVKMPRPAALAEPGFAERFSREIRSLVVLAHPHVVRILDVGHHDGRPFAVMPFLGGGNLRTRGIPAPPAALADWLEPIAQALDFVHERGFLHRDVKPPNILFDEHGQPYLSDFGIAKVLSSGPENKAGTNLTETGNVIGTAAYLAPELIMGKQRVDGRADQYALAATVYELLCGRVPFQGATPAAVMVKQTVAKLPPLRTHAPEVPKALAEAVEKGLNKDPKKRFPDCASFARAVLLAASESATATRRATPSPTGRTAAPGGRTRSVTAPPRTQTRPTAVEKAPETPVPPLQAPPSPSKPRPAAAERIDELQEVLPVSSPRRGKRQLVLACAFAALALGVGAGGLAAYWMRPAEETPEHLDPLPAQTPARIAIEPLGAFAVRAGESGRLAVRIRRDRVEGPVTLTCDGMPTGVTAAPVTIDSARFEGGVSFEATAGAAVGSTPVRLAAVAGSLKVETVFSLQVLPASRLTLTPSVKDQLLYQGDEPTTLRFTVAREHLGDKVVQLSIDRERLPDGVTADLATKELFPTANTFDVVLRASTNVAPDTTFPLAIAAELPGGQVQGRAVVNCRVDKPPVQVGRPEVTPAGEQKRIRVPVNANGYRGQLKATVSVPVGLELTDKPRVSEGHALFAVRQQLGATRQTARARLSLHAGGIALPAVTVPISIESPIVAALQGPTRPRRLQFTPDSKALLGEGSDARQAKDQFMAWTTSDWANVYTSPLGKTFVDPAGRWAMLRQPGQWDVWTSGGGKRATIKLDVVDARHVLSGDGERLAYHATVTHTTTKRDDKILVDGAGRKVEEKKETYEIRIVETSAWGQPITAPAASETGQLAGVTGDGRRFVEGKPGDWRVVQAFPAAELYPLKGREYDEVTLSPDDRYLACRSDAGVVLVLDARDGRRVLQTPELGGRLAVRFVPGRRLLALTDRNGSTNFWDLEKGTRGNALAGTASGPLSFPAPGLVHDRQRIWSVDTGKTLLRLTAGQFLGLSADGKTAIEAVGGVVSLVDLASRKRLFKVPTHASDVVQAALAPNGRYLAVADEAGLVQVLDLPRR